ncbi:MAG: toxin-antitoxin system HicB family antitoxin [Actinomycetota bacterium]
MDERSESVKYEYSVWWSEEDSEFVATCVEFPSLSWLDEDREAALRGIVSLVRGVVDDLAQGGEPIPEPLSIRRYSGKFQLRTTPQLHAKLVREASEQGVSLNALANMKLASH